MQIGEMGKRLAILCLILFPAIIACLIWSDSLVETSHVSLPPNSVFRVYWDGEVYLVCDGNAWYSGLAKNTENVLSSVRRAYKGGSSLDLIASLERALVIELPDDNQLSFSESLPSRPYRFLAIPLSGIDYSVNHVVATGYDQTSLLYMEAKPQSLQRLIRFLENTIR